ncbi:MAG: helix-turn-helix domain-containing protein [Oscillospiraceae bacterium]|jgi:transcriptional regulator with XRE-family HTH domain|nr:helix-turn-helix domain-containing protein [Oscillospiraceae bacterium]
MMFHEKLQQLRKEKGLSQESLAEMLDVSRQAVSKWESGQSYPEMDKLIALSDIFGVTLDSLVKDGELQEGGGNPTYAPFYMTGRTSYEYKSKRTLFGLPLLHVNIGFGAKKAKGVLAIGNIATGIVSIGLFARGLLSFGLLSIGVLAFGTLATGLLLAVGGVAAGTIAVGAVAIGIFALGAVAVGMFSFGAVAAASHIAVGDHVYGHIAVGRVAAGARTFIDTSPARNFSAISAEEVRKAITEEFPGLWNWIVRLMTSWFR